MADAWAGSTRAARLPADWPVRRAKVKARAEGRCEWSERGRRCSSAGVECDHVVPNDDHSLDNLQLLCGYHHGIKSAREGAAASVAARAKRPPRNRPPEQHPGLVT